ncbi:MAG: THUMP domain-containing protein [Candidatus Amulumruptor caecigallinarius]|nr:THUMP domain-containing protein [Candidatus Amulumruptor caecigallinarius]
MGTSFSMVAKTFQGLEDVLRDELISLGAENVEMGRRMVSFEGDLELMYKANLSLRTALRVLKPIEKFTAANADELYDIVREIEWEKYLTVKNTFMVDTTVNSGEFNHSKFVAYRVKDGIADHFRDISGERPSISVSNPDIMLNVHIDDDRVTISLDSSGKPLSMRGYRSEQTEAPINEVLAAGIIMKTGWRGDCDFADPMCGSGTFLVEAALIAANINPGIYRDSFAFEKWPDFNKDLFEELYNDDSAEREFAFKIYGGDIDAEAVRIARKNIKSAQVEDMIELNCRPMSDWIDNPESGVMVMNPPYGYRLKPEDITELYRGIGTCLKRNFPGWHAWIIGLNDEDFDNIGLKPSMKLPLLNGNLECSLREYILFDGKYDKFRAEGGRVSYHDMDDEQAKAPRKMRRLTDDEWKKETRQYGSHDKKSGFKSDRKQDRKFENRGDRKFENKGNRKFENKGDRKFENKGNRKFENKGDRKFENRSDRKPFKRGAVTVKPSGPKISADKAHIINPVHFRSRKQKEEKESE